ncbi:MAG: hypothetical protein ACOCRX_07100 [Candidatus Woesearchaeota archaeon]
MHVISISIFCEDTEELVFSYSDYLKTNHWEKIKMKFIRTED